MAYYLQLVVLTDQGRKKFDENPEWILEINKDIELMGVFIAIGHKPNTEVFKGQVTMDEQGYIAADNTRTSVPGIFAAGDVTDVPEKQIIIAAGEGAKAALQVHHYLQRKEDAETG